MLKKTILLSTASSRPPSLSSFHFFVAPFLIFSRHFEEAGEVEAQKKRAGDVTAEVPWMTGN
jgi:hypothetical protein